MTPKRRIHLSLLLLLTFFGLGNHVFFSLTTTTTPPKQQSNRRIVVVVFYHLPRTGGTTIREHFQTTVPYLRVAKHRDWDRIEQRIARNPDTSSSLFIELHGTVPGLAVLHERIQRWRDQGVPLFAFTVVREPVAWSRSYFHHFHAPNCTWNWCERDTYPLDEDENEHLWKTMVPNHQCQLLLLGQRENKQRRRRRPDDGRIHVTDEQCRHELVPLLEQDWDWIGTTETLETITLPLLTQILSLEPQSSSIRKTTTTTTTTKKNASPFQRRDNTQQLESATIQQIRQASSFDEALYERVRHERWQRKTTR